MKEGRKQDCEEKTLEDELWLPVATVLDAWPTRPVLKLAGMVSV